MASFDIGLSGLAAAQSAFDVIGNNIANASTPGYHRQRLELTTAFSSKAGSTTFIGGVNVVGVSRMIDTLLEQEILRQQSTQSSVSQQAAVLQTIETSFGEFASGGGLNAAIDEFFNALRDLSGHPDDSIWQNQLINTAETMASQFRTMGEYLDALDGQLFLQAENNLDSANLLVQQIAKLNSEISDIEVVGGQANNMRDQRDEFISQLSALIGIQTIARDHGVIDVSAGAIPLVTGGSGNPLELGYEASGRLGISIVGAENYSSLISGGTIGGLFALKNQTLSTLHDELNTLANALIETMNAYQVMGVGSAGSFTELTSAALGTGDLSAVANLSSGSLYVRLTNTATGEITRHAIAIDAANDSVTDVAAAFSAIGGMTASVNSASQLTITAGPDYRFDFLPAVLPEPTLVDFDDAAPPTVTVSGVYQGGVNDTLECTVIGDGAVGNGTLKLEVRNGSGGLLRTVNIGAGYAAGDLLELHDGVQIALGIGNLAETDGDTFSIDVYADIDAGGFLPAAGLNTLFSGNSAATMNVAEAILADPQRIATALGGEMTDNMNVTRMADVKDLRLASLSNMTVGQFYRAMITDVGQQLSTKKQQQENVEVMVLNLENQRAEVSGVNINEESAKLMIYQQMYQSMAKYMGTLSDAIDGLMDLV